MPWWGLIALLFLFSVNNVLAAFSFSLDSVSQDTLTGVDQILEIKINIADLPSPSYFRVAFQKESGEPYFGQIQNNTGNWVGIKSLSSDCHDYYLVSDTNTNTAVIKLRIGSDVQIDNGAYQLKAHRFTSSACSATPAQNTLRININLVRDAPSATIIPTQIPTHNPTSTSKPNIVTSKPEVTPLVLSSNTYEINTPILSTTKTIPSPSTVPSPVPLAQSVPAPKPNRFPAAFTILLGVVSIITASVKLYTFKDRLV